MGRTDGSVGGPARLAAGAIALALAAICGCVPGSGPTDDGKPPDIVLITVDTLRADHLGCYGYDRETSPNIDRLASRSLLFEDAVAAAPSTGPSVASIMTGKYPRFHTYGHDNGRGRLVPEEQTLAEILQAAGWATAAFVSNPVLRWRSGLDQGFEHYDEEMLQKERSRSVVERTAESATDAALAWVESRDDDRPLFLWVHYQDPHGPYTPPEEFVEAFPPKQGARALSPCRRGLGGSQLNCVPGYQRLNKPLNIDGYVVRYDGEIAYMDRELGRLLAGLRRHGIDDRDWMLLTSDHGESLGEQGRFFQHGHDVTRELSAVPMILHVPGGPEGERVRGPASHVDIFKTLASIAGAQTVTGGLDSAVDLARSGSEGLPDGRAVFCATAQQIAVHEADHMLVGRPRVLSTEDGGLRPAFDGQWLADYREDPLERIEDPPRRDTLVEHANRYLAVPHAEFAIYRPDGEQRKQLESLGYLQGN